MELSVIYNAKVFALFEVAELFSGRFDIFPKMIVSLVQRYNIRKPPQTIEELDFQKGIKFLYGQFEETPIDEIALWDNGIIIDTKTSAEKSEHILENMLTWGAEVWGLKYRPEMIKRKIYLSSVSFRSDVPLESINPQLRKLSERVTEIASKHVGHKLQFDVTQIGFYYDPTSTKLKLPFLTIERREDTPFSENKYYSSAPLPTDEHLKFLSDFEAILTGTH